VGNTLGEVKTTFTIDLTPYLEGLKSILTMTQQTGVQLKPLLNLQVKSADFSQINKTFQDYADKVKALVPVATDAVNSSVAIGAAAVGEATQVRKSSQAQDEHSLSLRTVKRDALLSFGAIAFLTQGVTQLLEANSGGNKELEKLNQGLNKGVSAGFGMAGILSMLGIATGGVAVGIGAVVTVGIALVTFFDKSAEKEKAATDAMKGFTESLRGANLSDIEAYRKKLLDLEQSHKNALEAAKQHKKELDNLASTTQADMEAATAAVEQEQLQYTNHQSERIAVDKIVEAARKSYNENFRMMGDARIAAIQSQYARERAMADQAMQDDINNGYSIEAAKAKHIEKIHEINLKELKDSIDAALLIKDAYLKADDERFENELVKTRSAGLQRGQDETQLDLQIIQARKARFQAQLTELEKIAGPLAPDQLAKQTALEKQITELEVQEGDKRKAIKQAEVEFTTKIQDLSLQATINKIKMGGVQQEKSQEQINLAVLAGKKTAIIKELALLTAAQAAGRQLDRKELERKAQLETDLTAIDLEGVTARKELAKQDAQNTTDALQTVMDNMTAAFVHAKAFAIAGAIISTYSAAQKAYEAVIAVPFIGPELAIAAAASAIADGLSRIATITAVGMATGTKVTQPTFALIGEAGPEIVAPEQTFIDVFKTDLAPRLIDILVPQIKASVLAAIGGSGQGGSGVILQINIQNYYGDQEYFTMVLKPAVEDEMRRAGTKDANTLFKNRKYI
jgi:hypothetical protein